MSIDHAVETRDGWGILSENHSLADHNALSVLRWKDWCHYHAQANFNTLRYKGNDSASGIGRKLSIIRPGATNVVAP
jgi:hypothetical protein